MPSRLRRVVPKNLFVSALTALDGPTGKGAIAESNVRDLCTLITLSMLYDEIETLGHKDELNGRCKPDIEEGYARIRELTGLDIVIGPKPKEADSIIQKSAAIAAEPFAEAGLDQLRISDIKQRLWRSLRFGMSDSPDYWTDFKEGMESALSSEEDSDEVMRGAEQYWLRSFIYAGMAAFRKTPLVPDAIRGWGLPITQPWA